MPHFLAKASSESFDQLDIHRLLTHSGPHAERRMRRQSSSDQR